MVASNVAVAVLLQSIFSVYYVELHI